MRNCVTLLSFGMICFVLTLSLFSCRESINGLIYIEGNNYYKPSSAIIFTANKSDSVLVLNYNGKEKSTLYSFHGLNDISDGVHLKNEIINQPTLALLGFEADTNIYFAFIDKKGKTITSLNPRIIINDSILTDRNELLFLQTVREISHPFTLQLQFNQGFDHHIDSCTFGSYIFQVVDSKNNSNNHTSSLSYLDYKIISDTLLDLKNPITLRRSQLTSVTLNLSFKSERKFTKREFKSLVRRDLSRTEILTLLKFLD